MKKNGQYNIDEGKIKIFSVKNILYSSSPQSGVVYAFIWRQLFFAEIVIFDDYKKSGLVLKFQNDAKNYFLAMPFFGHSQNLNRGYLGSGRS